MANTVDILGDDAVTDSIIDGSIAEFVDDQITIIGFSAFQNCSKLTSVDLPVVTSVGSSAYRGCSNLTSVILRNASQVVTLGGTSAFVQADNAIIYVPDALVDDYKAATNWSTYADRIKGLSELPA